MEALTPGDQGSQMKVREACSGLSEGNTARFQTLRRKTEDGGRDEG